MAQHNDPKDRTSKQSEQYEPRHGKQPHRGQHRAEDAPKSGPAGNRTSRPHSADGWFPER